MEEGKNQVRIPIPETSQMGAHSMKFEENSSVPRNDELPVDSSAKPEKDTVQKRDNGDGDVKRKRQILIILLIDAAIFASVMGALITSLTVEGLKNSMIWGFKIWRWCLLLLAVFCGGLTSYLLADVMLLIKKLRDDEIKLYYILRVKKSVAIFIWLGLIFLAWEISFDHGVKLSRDKKKIVDDISRGLGGCVIGAAIWLVKTCFVKRISSFTWKNLFEKLKKANHDRNILMSVLNENKVLEEDKVELAMKVIRNKKLPALCYVDREEKETKNEEEKEIKDEAEAEEAANKFFEFKSAQEAEKAANKFSEKSSQRDNLKLISYLKFIYI